MKTFNKNTLASAVGVAALALSVSAPVQAEGVTISGWINEAMIYSDDGVSSEVAQASDNGTTLGSRITFAGNTDVAPGINAGFEVILEPLSGNAPLLNNVSNQAFSQSNGAGVGVLGTSVNVGGAWGKMTLGLQSMPTDNIAVLADPSMTLWSSISPVFRGNANAIQGSGGALGVGGLGVTPGSPAGTDPSSATWGNFLTCSTVPGLGIGIDCNGIYRQGIRYDLPNFIENLNLAVGYANDDVWDVAGKYTFELGRVNAMLHAGYAVNSSPGAGAWFTGGSDNFQTQLGLMDPVTGLFGTFAYQHESVDGAAANQQDSTDAYWLKVGIKKQFNSLGDTSFDFQYGSYNDQFGNLNNTVVAGLGTGGIITGSEVQRIGFAVNQYIGSNLIIYGAYENLDLDVDASNAATAAAFNGGQDLDVFSLGLTYFF